MGTRESYKVFVGNAPLRRRGMTRTRIFLCGFMLVGLPLFAADSTQSPEKARAIEINNALRDMAQGGDSSPAVWNAVDAKIDGFQKEFRVTPKTTNTVVMLRKLQLKIATRTGEPSRYTSLIQKLSTDRVPEVAALVEKLVNLKSQPLDLKFTAVDGREVDLASLRGKVVLIDFWASWCPECRDKMADVVATYRKYHDQGLEVVGISLDQDKKVLQTFAAKNGMVWPQYFDGKGWDNPVSRGYGVYEIPAIWLVDKKGMLVSTDGRHDLAGQVEQLMAAPREQNGKPYASTGEEEIVGIFPHTAASYLYQTYE